MHGSNVHYLKQDYPKKKQRKRKEPRNKLRTSSLDLLNIKPKTDNQTKTFEEYSNNQNLLLHGVAGTGKSFISIYLALNELKYKSTNKKSVKIIRSVVPSRDVGFLPGNAKEKAKVYEAPYYSIFTELFGRGDAYDYCKQNGTVEFITTSFIRGQTFDNSIIIVDECQNMSWQELDTIMTRIGNNSRIIFCGDFRQTDLKNAREKEGLFQFMRVVHGMNQFSNVEFGINDIVRSSLVKEYIIEKYRNDLT